jgi:hypothetical protein
MSYFDHMGGAGWGSSPCANCEDEPKEPGSQFCGDECRREFEGEGEYA